MSHIDPELSRKLQSRRSFVDSEGTQYSPSEDQVNERKAQAVAAARARAFFQPSQQASKKQGLSDRGGSRVDNELVQKLQERRDVVDSRGSAWQKLPDNATQEVSLAHFSPAGLTSIPRDAQVPSEEDLSVRMCRSLSGGPQLDEISLVGGDVNVAEERGSAVGDLAGEELALKLQTRRGVVDAEGSAWQRVPQTPRGSASLQGVQSSSTVPPSPKPGTQQVRSRAGTLDSEGWSQRPSLQTPRDAGVQLVGSDSLPSELAQRLSARRTAIESGDVSETAVLDTELSQRLSARRGSFEGEPQGELAQRLSARLSVVEDEGSCWQSGPGAEAAAARVLGEARPWGELWRGEDTWLCEVWASNMGSWAALDGPLEGQPLVLGLSDDGTTFCFVPEITALSEGLEEREGEEGEEAACLVAVLPAGALHLVSKFSEAPALLGLHLGGASPDSGDSDDVLKQASSCCHVRFETSEGAASYLAALRRKSSFHAVVEDGPLPELVEPPSMPGESPEFSSAEAWRLPPAPQRWQQHGEMPHLKSGLGTRRLHDNFLEELDELAGFT